MSADGTPPTPTAAQLRERYAAAHAEVRAFPEPARTDGDGAVSREFLDAVDRRDALARELRLALRPTLEARPVNVLDSDLALAATMGVADVAVLIHELRRITANGPHWSSRYAVDAAANALRLVGDPGYLPGDEA